MPDESPKRGAIPSHRSALAGAAPYRAQVGLPLNLIMKPQQISMWGNSEYGDCVTAEEAFAKACNNPEIFVPDDTVIAWATRHGVLNGAYLPQVMTWMQNDGFVIDSVAYDDGPYFAVDWSNAAILRSAISEGPVKIGVAADQIETAWHTTGGKSGWFGTGFHADNNEDHCVALCGYGSLDWLAEQFGVQVPPGVSGAQPGYAMFTWNSIGIIDVPSMLAVTHEAWLRRPTTVTKSLPTWHRNDLTAATGAPAAAGDPAGYTLASTTQHVVYRGTDNHIHELWWDNNGWHHGDLTAATGSPAATGDPAGYTLASTTQHVVYRGTDNHIHELWWG